MFISLDAGGLEVDDNVATTVDFSSTEYALLTASLLAFFVNIIVLGVSIGSNIVNNAIPVIFLD